VGSPLLTPSVALKELVPAYAAVSSFPIGEIYSERNGFSIAILQTSASNKKTGYYLESVTELKLSGSFILSGFSNGVRHATAVRNGYFIDSQRNQITDLRFNPIPSYYKINIIFKIMKGIPPQITEYVDLT